MSQAPYAHLVVPVDFSDASRDSAQVAVAMAKQSGVSLTFLHAIHVETPAYLTESAQRDVIQQFIQTKAAATDYLKEWSAGLLTPGLQAEFLVMDRPAVEAIREVVAAKPGSWVVMGTHGRTGLQKLWLGSVTQRTLKDTGVPVVVIPPRG
jgi:nucleotide-binding universal stress UspA family protein